MKKATSIIHVMIKKDNTWFSLILKKQQQMELKTLAIKE